MRLIVVTSTALLLSAGVAIAANPSTSNQAVQGMSPSGPVSKEAVPTQTPSSSGRPSAILSQNECDDIWGKAVQGSNTLTAESAAKYISNFKLADSDHDGRISQSEFRDACSKGWVQAQAQN